jgi:hypothetical protein
VLNIFANMQLFGIKLALIKYKTFDLLVTDPKH